MIGRLSAYSTFMSHNSGLKSLSMTDLTDKFHPFTQDKFDRMFISGSNLVVCGAWGWKNLPPSLVGKAYNLVRKMRDSYDATLAKYDLIVTPTLGFLPVRLTPTGSTKKEMMQHSAGMGNNTQATNLVRSPAARSHRRAESQTGHPALTLPIATLPSPHGDGVQLPVGMQLIGKFFDEGTIYRAAYAWEQAYDWRKFQQPEK